MKQTEEPEECLRPPWVPEPAKIFLSLPVPTSPAQEEGSQGKITQVSVEASPLLLHHRATELHACTDQDGAQR